MLTGKYNDGNIPEGSRYDKYDVDRNWNSYMGPDRKEANLIKLNAMAQYAQELGVTQA